jgi:hypothetical protein
MLEMNWGSHPHCEQDIGATGFVFCMGKARY